MNSWAVSACYPRSTFYPLSDGPSIQNHRITKTYFRTCSTCLSRSQARFCLYTLRPISDRSERTFVLLRYSLGGDRPSQTAHHTLSSIRMTDQTISISLSLGWRQRRHRYAIRAGVTPYTSTFVFAECCVFNKQSQRPGIFDRHGLTEQVLHPHRRTFSRSYGAILPSSFTRVLSSALVFSTQPPVSVWGTVPSYLKLRSFSWKHGINHFIV
ncbi:hypothetical protein Lal_00008619 [Lupinus albus]|nr:hypothetical protein Lal_00008619 [Lupinus albus]